ncbi:hypothetical protein GLP21_12405 [Photobacterium carnosum]|uniref:Uncharacterized protein n=1 Tax=Photobacterium carnosum TaxID=2023717 RepID=A0A2N4UW53_9GAMM|nr:MULTISPECIES: hypothetical protein [Photobacterium]MCD9475868.1 hypothetical protein [Photobacterium phosphoreum]MCD9485919.1 hypothetical protein [Photobacterium iliopiscarium]MCD9507730.1 hypothetical protein [Photobacterium phosphoreum]MCD9538149.1 hypothetical protein [Photobacterium carnosum]MCD9542564.1 hypothetical protein [Photobacterium carnosum]
MMDDEKLTVSKTIHWAIKCGWKVVAAVRGMAFTQDKDINFYIDVIAESPDQKEKYDIGFWPGINKDYRITENDLAEIKWLHPAIKIERNVTTPSDRSNLINVTNRQ